MANLEYQNKIKELVTSDNVLKKFQESSKSMGMMETATFLADVKNLIQNIDSNAELSASNFEYIREVILPLIVYSYFNAIKVNVSNYREDNTILFKECSYEITGILSDIYNTTILLDNSIKGNLLSNINKSLDFASYTDEMFDNDIDYLYSVCCKETEEPEEYNQKVIEDIKESAVDGTFLNVIGGWYDRKKELYSILEAVYANTFSLYPYEGVLFFRGKQKRKITVQRNGQAVQKETVETLNSLTRQHQKNKIEKMQPVHRPASQTTINAYEVFCQALQSISDDFKKSMISYDRCFDMDTILDEKHSLYYPYESFGFAVGAEFSDYYKPKENDIVYTVAPVSSWSAYFKEIEPKLDDLFIKYVYKALEKYCTVDEGKSFKFTDTAFLDDYVDYVEDENTSAIFGGKAQLYEKYCSAASFSSTVNNAIERFCRTICKAAIITRNDSDELYKLRICSEDVQAFDVETTPKKLFDNNVITQNRADVVFDTGIVVKKSPLLGIVVMDYQFCLNPEIVNAKPLFGYKAAKLFQQNGTVIDKNNLLIGEDQTGTPIFSSEGSKIDTTSKIVHRFSAGSRSGKGVITMNILASLVASDTSVFYVDRKPDMASELSYITHGDLYCVNGADLQLGEDTRRQFKKHGADAGTEAYSYMLDKFKPGSHLYKQSYMTGAFGNDFGDKWEKIFGDLIYERAFLFAISIMVARLAYIQKNTPENSIAYQELDLGNNMAIVIDEITNWHVNFEHRYFGSYAGDPFIGESVWRKFYNGSYGASKLDSDNEEDLLSSIENDTRNRLQFLKEKADSLRDALNQGADEDKIKELDKINKEIQKILKEKNTQSDKLPKSLQEGYLYWTTFHDKMTDILTDIGNIQNAGWKPEMAKLHDVFMIGQMITGCAKPGAPIKFKVGKGTEQGVEREVYVSGVETQIRTSGDVSDDATYSFLVNFANTLGNDWFTGRLLSNPDDPEGKKRPNFGAEAMKESNPSLYKWLHLDGNWMYIKDGDQELFRSGESKSIPQEYVPVKPYLVLNNNLEQPKNLTDEEKKDAVKYKYVNGCKRRIETIRPGTWDKIRPDFLDDDGKTLHEGIGLKGLVKEYKRTQDPTWDWSKGNPFAKSKTIADNVARRLNPKYSSYMDLLLDLTPAGLFSSRDIIRVYDSLMANQPLAERENLEQQLPRYFMANKADLITNNANTLNDSETNATEQAPKLDNIDIVYENPQNNRGGYSEIAIKTSINKVYNTLAATEPDLCVKLPYTAQYMDTLFNLFVETYRTEPNITKVESAVGNKIVEDYQQVLNNQIQQEMVVEPLVETPIIETPTNPIITDSQPTLDLDTLDSDVTQLLRSKILDIVNELSMLIEYSDTLTDTQKIHCMLHQTEYIIKEVKEQVGITLTESQVKNIRKFG